MQEPRSVLITGCSSGIGRHVALGLKTRGYRVFAAARKEGDVIALRQTGLESLQLDLNNSASVQYAIRYVLDRTQGKLYALFNNAGFGVAGAVEDLGRDALRDQLEVNLLGTHELTRAVIPVMRQQGFGRIIQNSSMLGFIALPLRGAYVASKYALEGLSDALRLELSGTDIHISLIEPGPIESAFRKNSYAACLRYIDKDSSVFRDTYQKTGERLQKEGPAVPFTLGPEAVLKKVIHALESKRPKARYYVTFPAYLFGYLKRALPTAALDTILARI